jgi:hypothetical protein
MYCHADETYDWHAEATISNEYGWLLDFKSPFKRVISKGEYTVENVSKWMKAYQDAIDAGDFSKMSRIALVDLIFGRLMPQIPGSSELQRLSAELGGPVKFSSNDGVWLNLGSPVDRRSVPFWHWVAQNITDAK